MRTKLLVVLLAAALAAPATSSAAPALSLSQNCSQYPPFHGVDISLTGLPPNTVFTGSLRFASGFGYGPAQFTTDASGSFVIGPFGSSVPDTATATVDWAGGTLTQSLELDCRLPTRKEECKNGGWKSYGVFRNQGDCVSFVATGGKNPPGR